MIYTRETLEELEKARLRPYAVASGQSKGRRYAEPNSEDRLCFQRDRDRILHSRAFRRLKGKTQVFIAHKGDHHRTRLSHTLEVAQISRDMSRSIGLNEDLAETIALAHDLGHTPFGHAGQDALHDCLKPYGMSFEHNEQSLHIVEDLELAYPDFPGLNLSYEVLQGLMKHRTPWDNADELEPVFPSLEAQLVNVADQIAYHYHDLDDGLEAGLIREEQVMELQLWKDASEHMKTRYGSFEKEGLRFTRAAAMVAHFLIVDVYSEFEWRLKEAKIETLDDVYSCPHPLIGFSDEMRSKNKELKDFFVSKVYMNPRVSEPAARGQEVIQKLFRHFLKDGNDEASLIKTRDYLAGMTDAYALEQVKLLGL